MDQFRVIYVRQNGKVVQGEWMDQSTARTVFQALQNDPDCVAAQLQNQQGQEVAGYNMPYPLTETNPLRDEFERLKQEIVQQVLQIEDVYDLRQVQHVTLTLLAERNQQQRVRSQLLHPSEGDPNKN
ncbi:hypothetical protein [Deinococcus roseus]|uniref:Uncharacterized protein n=1 Tax=Deinococcus roseus TaxID=392414 RepID=A0ABQ2DFN7_9DEIO|nr:hypothetical protein [Deinococcus roseus]GGJ55638.1 hypothetical protein GCM10008938_47260 [Deinococcus roseus]